MKKLVSIAASLLISINIVSAWSGGPWSNDGPTDEGGDGTYQASMSGRNLIGVATFRYDSTSESTGTFALFHEGQTYYGMVFGQVNMLGRLVSAVLYGGFADSSESGGGEGGGTSSVSIQSPPANGGFTARINQTRPVVTFEGQGQVTTLFTPRTDSVFNEDVSTTVRTELAADGSEVETIVQTTSADTTLQNTAESVPFRVRGIRSSLNSNTTFRFMSTDAG